MVYVRPPSVELLNACPRFESLHKQLTLSLLDQDGAVKSQVKSPPSIQVRVHLLLNQGLIHR